MKRIPSSFLFFLFFCFKFHFIFFFLILIRVYIASAIVSAFNVACLMLIAFSVVLPFSQAVTSRGSYSNAANEIMGKRTRNVGSNWAFNFGQKWCIHFNTRRDRDTHTHAHNFDIDKYRRMTYLFLRFDAFAFFEPLLPRIFWLCN